MPTAPNRRPTDFRDTPEDQARLWTLELDAAKKALREWHEQVPKLQQRFLDDRGEESVNRRMKRVNLFTANVQTQRAMVYGRTPKASATRRFMDAGDDVARVACEILERVLNSDLEREGDTTAGALGYALDDRLLGGYGQVRCRYEVDTEEFEDDADTDAGEDVETDAVSPTSVPAQSLSDSPPLDAAEVARAGPSSTLSPAVPPTAAEKQRRKVAERVCVDYVYWHDELWSPARTPDEIRWRAFRSHLTPDAVEDRWGKDIADAIPYNVGAIDEREGDKDNAPNPWQRAEVWEIWDKPRKQVVWYVPGHDKVLETKKDPLGLANFFPCPMAMLANPVNGRVMPRPDFCLAEDLYNEVDVLSERIALLVRAVRVTGLYDQGNKNAQLLLGEATENKLYPVDNWAAHAEKGGIKGSVDWLPLDQIVQAIMQLQQQKDQAKQELYEVTGMSDIMRGQAAAAEATATEQRIKARFASVRMQQLQDEFAKFATQAQAIKAEVVCKFFDAERIKEVSNANLMEDAKQPGLIDQAIALLKDDHSAFRIEVKPENVSMLDYTQSREESTAVIGAMAQFFQAAQPVAEAFPSSKVMLLELLQWFMSKQKGASTVEGILDRAVAQQQAQEAQAAANPQPPPPDPKVQAQQLKGQQEMAQSQADLQGDLQRIAAQSQADMEKEANQTRENTKEALAKHLIQQQGKQQDARRQLLNQQMRPMGGPTT